MLRPLARTVLSSGSGLLKRLTVLAGLSAVLIAVYWYMPRSIYEEWFTVSLAQEIGHDPTAHVDLRWHAGEVDFLLDIHSSSGFAKPLASMVALVCFNPRGHRTLVAHSQPLSFLESEGGRSWDVYRFSGRQALSWFDMQSLERCDIALVEEGEPAFVLPRIAAP